MIKIVVIEKGKFKVINTLRLKTNFGKVGGSFLDELKKDLDVQEVKKVELKTNVMIDDILIFKEDNYIELKEKIAVISNIPPSKQLLFDNIALGFEYIIDGVNAIVDPHELLEEYDDANNILFKFQGDYEFKDYSYKKIKPFTELYLLSSDEYKKDGSVLNDAYFKKFWPFDNNSVHNYQYYVNASKVFNELLRTKAISSFYVNETTSFINKYTKTSINVGSLMDVSLACVGAKYSYIYKDKHIFKYIDVYKLRKEFDPLAFNIHLIALNIKLTISVYPNGTIRLFSQHYNYRLDLIIKLYEQRLPCIFQNLGLNMGPHVFNKVTITSKYTNNITGQVFNQLRLINEELACVIKNVTQYNNKYTMVIFKNVEEFYDMSITNEHTRLTFLVEKVDYGDLDFINKLISFYVSRILKDTTFDIDIDKINKNRRLQERDPIAYPKSLKWSRVCQSPNQPIIFNTTEYNLLPEEYKKNAIKYYNFTTEDDAYYLCNHKTLKYIGFKNVNNLGLPCCQKRSLEKLSKDKRKEYERILKTHIYIKTEEKIFSRYEVKYSKFIGIDRVMSLPNLFQKWLTKNNIKEEYEYKLLGVSQVDGILGCYAHALDVDSKKVNVDSVNLILIRDESNTGESTFILSNDKYDVDKKFLIVFVQSVNDNKYYTPLYGINAKRYNSKKIIDHKLFNHDNFIVKSLLAFKTDHLIDSISESYNIITKYIFNDSVLYVLIQKGNNYALLPMNHPVLEVSKQSIKPPDLSLKMPLSFLMTVLEDVNIHPTINKVLVNDRGEQIGFLADGLVYHHSPIRLKNTDENTRVFINYPLQDVYNTIYKDIEPTPINPIIDNTLQNEVDQFKLEIFKKTNTSLRAKIESIFKTYEGGERLLQLYQLMSRRDYDVIKKTNTLQEALSLHYSFDNLTIEKLLNYSEKELDSYLSKYSSITKLYLKAIIQNPLAFEILLNETIMINIKTIKKHDNERIITY